MINCSWFSAWNDGAIFFTSCASMLPVEIIKKERSKYLFLIVCDLIQLSFSLTNRLNGASFLKKNPNLIQQFVLTIGNTRFFWPEWWSQY